MQQIALIIRDRIDHILLNSDWSVVNDLIIKIITPTGKSTGTMNNKIKPIIKGIISSRINAIIIQIIDNATSIIATITVTINNMIARGILRRSPKNKSLALKFSHATGI